MAIKQANPLYELFMRLPGKKYLYPPRLLTSQKNKNLVKVPFTAKPAPILLIPGLNCQEAQN
jgi:hypothetical protein